MIEVQTRPAPVETVTPLKPSEALRLAELSGVRQAFGSLYDQRGGLCAWGALMSVGGVTPSDVLGELIRRNDDLRHSFGQIADWLEGMGY
jgi:hypothetical protein